jgi:membrane protein
MFARAKTVLKAAISEFIATNAASRGAAIAFYTVTSFVPVLIIAIAVAAVVFGEDAARGAIVVQLRGLLGQDGARLLEDAIRSASDFQSGTVATVVGVAALIATSSGVFVELRNGLNAIWQVRSKGETLSRFLKARAASFGLVLALGFLLLVSLVTDAMVTALGGFINAHLPHGAALLGAMNFLLSFGLVTFLFATIYKILPERRLEWRDVIVGATTTALLFHVGKSLIAFYLGSGGAASSFGSAGAVIALLFWIFYSAQIVLFGAALTEAIMAEQGKKPSVKSGSREPRTQRRAAAVTANDRRA